MGIENWSSKMVEGVKGTIDLDATFITDEQSREMEELLGRLDTNSPQQEDVWRLMDEVWDEIGLNNRKPGQKMLGQFYSHSVWLLNSLFIEQDTLSMGHRRSIRDWIQVRADEIRRVVDFGGGLGTLGILIGDIGDHISVDIYEPYSSRLAQSRLQQKENVQFIKELVGSYDCLLAVDVLEHVTDPIKILDEMAKSVRPAGYLIIANNFSPVIKCHLPGTFHLRFSFRFLARLIGLSRLGPCVGSHATVYMRTPKQVNWVWIRAAEKISMVLYYPLHVPYFFYRLLRPAQIQ